MSKGTIIKITKINHRQKIRERRSLFYFVYFFLFLFLNFQLVCTYVCVVFSVFIYFQQVC
jgi:hypothetical protein